MREVAQANSGIAEESIHVEAGSSSGAGTDRPVQDAGGCVAAYSAASTNSARSASVAATLRWLRARAPP